MKTHTFVSYNLPLAPEEVTALRCLLAWERESPRVSPAVARDLARIEKRLKLLAGA